MHIKAKPYNRTNTVTLPTLYSTVRSR